jgi:hypothetical protein
MITIWIEAVAAIAIVRIVRQNAPSNKFDATSVVPSAAPDGFRGIFTDAHTIAILARIFFLKD